MSATCSMCRFYLAGTANDGLCRRYPPPDSGRLGWPVTGILDWCGEFDARAVEECGALQNTGFGSGYVCTMPKGHFGDHRSMSDEANPQTCWARWPAASPASEPSPK